MPSSQAGLNWWLLGPGVFPRRGRGRAAVPPCWCHAALLSPIYQALRFPRHHLDFCCSCSSFSSPDPSLSLCCIIFYFLGFPFVPHLPPRCLSAPFRSFPGVSVPQGCVRADASRTRRCLSCPSIPIPCGQGRECCLLPAQSEQTQQRVSGKLSAERIRAARQNNKTYCC